MENSEENEIENVEQSESPTKAVKKKKRTLLNIGIVLIIMQFLSYYGGTPILGENLNFNKINSNNYGFFISTFIGQNFFLTIGVLLIAIYFFIYRKK